MMRRRMMSLVSLQRPFYINRYFCSSSEVEDQVEDEIMDPDQGEWESIGNNSSVKEVRSLIRSGKKTKFTGNYHNLLCLYRGLKKKTELSASPPYHKTKQDLFQFQLQRRVLQRDVLNSLQVEIERSNVKSEAKLVNVTGSDKAITFPKLPLDMQLDSSLVNLDSSGSGTTSFHFLMAYRSCYKRTVPVKELGGSLEVGFGVFPPTRRDYIRLYDAYFKQWCLDNRRDIHRKKFPLTILDVGCGSGVLGFLTLKHITETLSNPSLKAYLLGVDQYHEAVRCSTNNSKSLSFDSNSFFIQSSNDLFPILEDIPNSARKRPLSKHVKALKENQFDFIVCNPPWLPSDTESTQNSKQDKDGGLVSFSDSYVFDDSQNKFHERFFSNVKQHLKEEGRILLVHSNLANLIGLQSNDYISQLCKNNSLKVLGIFETNAKVKFSQKDWFADEKSKSKVLLYEIVHDNFEIASMNNEETTKDILSKK